jgi:hypothetical protein
MTDQLKMTLATVAIEHAVTNPLGRWLGQRRFAFDCMCGGTITEDRNIEPTIDRDTAYNMHLLVAAMKAVHADRDTEIPTRTHCTCEVGMGTFPGSHHEWDRATRTGCPLYRPTAEGKPA